MEEALVFIERQQVWIFLLLGIFALIYLRQMLLAVQEARASVYGLEKERSLGKLRRAAAMLTLAGAGLVATLVITTFVSPRVPLSARPTAIPTVSLLSSPSPPAPAQAPGGLPPTSVPEPGLDGSGCLNPQATLTSPVEGQSLTGMVEVRGTADIVDFALYKYEYRSSSAGSVWRSISAGTQPVVDGVLGSWDTSLVLPDEYLFRLVVTDTAGNAPLPCVIKLYVAPAQ
jgi:hypothetical protein